MNRRKKRMTEKIKKEINWKVLCTGIICITGLEICALIKGIDGILLTGVIGVIAAVIGIIIPSPIKIK